MMILDMATGEVEQAAERREPEAAETLRHRAPASVAALQEATGAQARPRHPDAGLLAGLDIAAFIDAQR